MKKIYIAMAVLATAALTSCVQEQSFEGHVLQEGEVAFVLQAGPSTKVAETDSPVRAGASIKLGMIGGQNLMLEETIIDQSYVTPQTKGTPVFTENVGKLYKDELLVHTNYADFEETTFTTEEENKNDQGAVTGWRYFHRYDNVPWPSGAVDFYMRMPATVSAITSPAYSNGQISFTYTSPTSATAQQDLIFAYASITEAQHKAYFSQGGYPVTFYHALTGVKFAIGNSAAELAAKGIVVKEIKFTNLVNSGTCTVSPSAEGDKVSWTNVSATADNEISQDLTEEGVGVITFDSETDNNNFGNTFFTGGTNQNVNKADASYTFWLIPQSFASSTAVLRISYTMSGRDEYMDISLKKYLSSYPWKAGQLRTFTFKLDDVNVKIEDTVTPAGEQGNAYQGSVKSNPIVTNTGNKNAYIRAAIVGQWWDIRDPQKPAIVFGFRDEVNNLYLVESWYQDQFVNKEKNHGEFVGLAGYQDNTKNTTGAVTYNGWTLCTDGYYYYNSIVTPEPADANPNASSKPWQTTPLFTSYTLKTPPQAIDPITLGVLPAGSLYFTLEIATQAISAADPSKMDGSDFDDWKEAWKNADADKKAPVPVQ